MHSEDSELSVDLYNRINLKLNILKTKLVKICNILFKDFDFNGGWDFFERSFNKDIAPFFGYNDSLGKRENLKKIISFNEPSSQVIAQACKLRIYYNLRKLYLLKNVRINYLNSTAPSNREKNLLKTLLSDEEITKLNEVIDYFCQHNAENFSKTQIGQLVENNLYFHVFEKVYDPLIYACIFKIAESITKLDTKSEDEDLQTHYNVNMQNLFNIVKYKIENKNYVDFSNVWWAIAWLFENLKKDEKKKELLKLTEELVKETELIIKDPKKLAINLNNHHSIYFTTAFYENHTTAMLYFTKSLVRLIDMDIPGKFNDNLDDKNLAVSIHDNIKKLLKSALNYVINDYEGMEIYLLALKIEVFSTILNSSNTYYELLKNAIPNPSKTFKFLERDLANWIKENKWCAVQGQEHRIQESSLIFSYNTEFRKELTKLYGKIILYRKNAKIKRPFNLLITSAPGIGKSSLVEQVYRQLRIQEKKNIKDNTIKEQEKDDILTVNIARNGDWKVIRAKLKKKYTDWSNHNKNSNSHNSVVRIVFFDEIDANPMLFQKLISPMNDGIAVIFDDKDKDDKDKLDEKMIDSMQKMKTVWCFALSSTNTIEDFDRWIISNKNFEKGDDFNSRIDHKIEMFSLQNVIDDLENRALLAASIIQNHWELKTLNHKLRRILLYFSLWTFPGNSREIKSLISLSSVDTFFEDFDENKMKVINLVCEKLPGIENK